MAASEGFRVRVLTPAGLALEERASSAKVPTADGEIGVLPQHTKYSAVLGEGILELVTIPSGETKKLTIHGGLTHFAADTLTVLADRIDL